MDLTPHLDAVRNDLALVVGSDPATAEIADRLARALEPSLLLRLLDTLGQAAVELADQLPSGRVDVRLAGRDVQLTYVADEPAPAARPTDEEPTTSRLTLRMPERLKTAVEAAAAMDGLSTNAWLVDAVQRGLEHRPRRRGPGHRLSGWAEA